MPVSVEPRLPSRRGHARRLAAGGREKCRIVPSNGRYAQSPGIARRHFGQAPLTRLFSRIV